MAKPCLGLWVGGQLGVLQVAKEPQRVRPLPPTIAPLRALPAAGQAINTQVTGASPWTPVGNTHMAGAAAVSLPLPGGLSGTWGQPRDPRHLHTHHVIGDT